jgi:hypothetical protein
LPPGHRVVTIVSRSLIFRDGAPGRAFEVVVLTALEGPEETEQPDKPEAKG